MNYKSMLFLLFLLLCRLPNAFGAVEMRFENRWPFTPAKSIAVSDNYIFQAFGNVVLVIDKTDFSNPTPVKRIALTVSEGITNLRYQEPFLFVTTGHHGLSKINVSPQSITDPAMVTREPIPAWTQSEIDAGVTESGTARDVAIDGNNAYVAFTKLYENGIYETGIQVLDIAGTSLVLKNLGLVTNDAIASGLASGLTESRRIMISGNYAYIADTAQGIHLFNIAADTPEFLDITGFLPTFDISVPGDGFAYAACTAGGIQILDIATDPNAPSITTIFANPTGDDPDDELTYFQYNDATTFARSLQTVESRIYVADGNSGLEILDVSTSRSNPQKLSTYGTNLNNTYSVHVEADDTLYLADFQSGLTKIDISSPAAPSLISSIQHHAAHTDRFFVNMEGDIFYSYTVDSGASGEGLRILKFEKVSNIYGSLVSNSEFQNVRFQSFLETDGQAQDIEVIHYKIPELTTTYSFAFIADGTGGLQIIDVTNKATPSNTDLTDNTEVNDSRAVELDSSGSFAFVADGSNGLRIMQIRAASDDYPRMTPTLLDTIAPPSGGAAKDVLFTSKGSAPNLEYYLYVAAGTAGLQIIRLDLPNGTLISSLDTDGDTKSVTVFDKYAFLADGDKGLKIINISDPESPELVGSYDTPGDASRVWIRQASANTVYAYIADGDKGVRAIDVSDPTAPVDFDPAITYDTAGFSGDIAVNQTGDMAIVGDGAGGLTMISISDPESGGVVDYTDTESPDINDSGCFIQSCNP